MREAGEREAEAAVGVVEHHQRIARPPGQLEEVTVRLEPSRERRQFGGDGGDRRAVQLQLLGAFGPFVPEVVHPAGEFGASPVQRGDLRHPQPVLLRLVGVVFAGRRPPGGELEVLGENVLVEVVDELEEVLAAAAPAVTDQEEALQCEPLGQCHVEGGQHAGE